MNIQEALANIGKEFKWIGCPHWDFIREVRTEDQMIIGDKIEAPVEDCRLKQEVPIQFRKENVTAGFHLDKAMIAAADEPGY